MKKQIKRLNLLIALLFVSVCLVSVTSCGSDSEDEEEQEYKELIVGTWRVDYSSDEYSLCTFKKSGSVIQSVYFNGEHEYTNTGIYEIKGEKLYISGAAGSEKYMDIFTIVSINATTMTLYYEGGYRDDEYVEENPGLETYKRIN